MTKTNIGWTDESWNPVTGCSHVSPGCEACYAEALSLRFGYSKKPWTAPNAAENVVLHPDRLDQPLHWKKPRRVFVNSMSDLFHEQVPDGFVFDVFCIMERASEHSFQVLTKRPERMCELVTRFTNANLQQIEGGVLPLPNVWLGVSVEDQRRADERIPLLLETPAAVRFLSCEPLLGAVDLKEYIWQGESVVHDEPDWTGDIVEIKAMLHWIIVGGESGSSARICPVEHIESIVHQCRSANIPAFVKQDAGRYPGKQGRLPDDIWALKEYPA